MIDENNLGVKILKWELAKWEKLLHDTERNMLECPNEFGANVIRECQSCIGDIWMALRKIKE